jgi:arginine-tRNA-protein transferase
VYTPDYSVHPCGYLAGLTARTEHLYWPSWEGRLPGDLYQRLMDNGFRRSGRVLYRPVCDGCRACIPIRIEVAGFSPSRSQRRSLRRNADVAVSWDRPRWTPEKVDLYSRYLAARHAGSPQAGASIEDFLYERVTVSVEAEYRLGGRLVALGICDLTPHALSTVYFYFDPAESRRGLGLFSTLVEIEQARRWKRPYYYYGYWVPGCAKMEYKASTADHELLVDGRWERRPRRL